MKLFKTILIFIVLLSNLSFAGTIDPSTSDSKYINFGADFYCVHKICGIYKDKTSFCASAVAIDKNHILTAAHVVKNYETCHITIQDKKYKISNIIIHDTFENGGFGLGDIALGYCDEDLGLEAYPPIYTKNDEIGKICAISGYGLTGTFNTGANIYDGKKRAGSNRIDFITKDLLICTPSKRSSPDFTSLEFIIASGDSGGGLFIDGKLAGINSCLMVNGRPPASKYGEEAGFTRVYNFIDWINKHKNKNR